MPNIKLYTSNRLEILADRLAEIVKKPLSSPFKSEAIVVQSMGMERWISMQLAERLGIWSNCRYYFPNQIVDEIIGSDERLFNKKINTWTIMRILPEHIEEEEFGSLKDYLAGDKGYVRYYELASLISDTFDQYLTYRPDMINSWDTGKDRHWQAELWRSLMGEVSIIHPPALKEIFFEKIKNPDNFNFNILPERISLFGISNLPLFHLDVLAAISDFIEVSIFFMNPCREYWADIRPEKTIAKQLHKYKDDYTSKELHLEKGNSLLASMGKAGGDYLSNLMKYDIEENQSFADPEGQTLLASIQTDILNMTEGLDMDSGDPVKFTADQIKTDNSIRIHSCHSPMREIEVLYDNLLDMFNNDPDLEPRDIIVMTPDIEIYSPYINAVFSAPLNEESAIPFSIADRSISDESQIIKTLLAILDLNDKRFGAGSVLDIIESPEVSSMFRLSAADLNLIRGWIRDTNINWGIDAEDREKLGLPKFAENTWKAGIERMLLGYAMPGNDGLVFNGILPFDDIEGNSAALGKFTGFFYRLAEVSESVTGMHSLYEWNNILINIFNKMFKLNESENSRLIIDAINSLSEIEKTSGFYEQLELAVIKKWLENELKVRRIKTRFITGGVTFCEMLPMRSIPFRAICLIGMNDNSFPRPEIKISFDLIARNPMRGDRSRRNDDRYLFLESIISARNMLYISYVGQHIKDNSEIPPSTVVSEILDYIENYNNSDIDIKNYIFIKHPLQAFSPRYFRDDTGLFSYSGINCRAAKSTLSERMERDVYIRGGLGPLQEDDEKKRITLDDIIKFFANPAKHILANKLGIYLDDKSDVLNETEPFLIGGLDKYHLEDALCDYFLSGRDPDDLYKTAKAAGMLPHGIMGELAFKNLIPGVKDFSGRITEPGGKELDPFDVKLEISGVELSGRLDNIRTTGMVLYRYADVKAKDRINAWIKHLVLNASTNKEYPKNSILICKNGSWEMEQEENSINILNELIDIYLKGGNKLVYFFPETSFEYASIMYEQTSHDKALKAADRIWTGNDFSAGEGTDPYYYLCFRNINPLNDDFTATALKIFEPMLRNQKKR